MSVNNLNSLHLFSYIMYHDASTVDAFAFSQLTDQLMEVDLGFSFDYSPDAMESPDINNSSPLKRPRITAGAATPPNAPQPAAAPHATSPTPEPVCEGSFNPWLGKG